MATGEIQHIYKGRAPGKGAVLATAGDLVFWGDLDQKFRAFDAQSGEMVWETTLGGTIQNSTITYAVNGKQYIAVLTGEGLMTGASSRRPGCSRRAATTRCTSSRCRERRTNKYDVHRRARSKLRHRGGELVEGRRGDHDDNRAVRARQYLKTRESRRPTMP